MMLTKEFNQTTKQLFFLHVYTLTTPAHHIAIFLNKRLTICSVFVAGINVFKLYKEKECSTITHAWGLKG